MAFAVNSVVRNGMAPREGHMTAMSLDYLWKHCNGSIPMDPTYHTLEKLVKRNITGVEIVIDLSQTKFPLLIQQYCETINSRTLLTILKVCDFDLFIFKDKLLSNVFVPLLMTNFCSQFPQTFKNPRLRVFFGTNERK